MPSSGCSRASSVPISRPSRVATSRPAPPSASRSSSDAGGVVGAHPLGHQPVRRPGVQLPDDPERRRTGDLVAGPQRVLDGRGAAPGGQHGEVQVHPAVRSGMSSADCGSRAPYATTGQQSGRQRPQRLLELRVARVVGLEDRDAELGGALGDRRRREPAPAAGRRVRPGDHADQLVRRGRDRVEGRQGRPPASRRRPPSLEAEPERRVRRHLDRRRLQRRTTPTRGSPSSPACGSRRRAGRGTARRRGGRSRAGWPGRAAREPSIVTGSPCMSKPLRDHRERPAAVDGQARDRQAALRAVLGARRTGPAPG